MTTALSLMTTCRTLRVLIFFIYPIIKIIKKLMLTKTKKMETNSMRTALTEQPKQTADRALHRAK
jgi:hypothetical protein